VRSSLITSQMNGLEGRWCNMFISEGNHLKLAGITRHGKNRIRENGDLWEVNTVDGRDSSLLTTKVCVAPLKESRRGEWRWIDVPRDEHMEILEVIE